MKKLVFSLIFILSAFAVFSQTTPKKITKTKVVEPIYSIFQTAEQDKIKREDSLGKTQIQCAPPLPKVRSDDIIFAKRITRDIYFADPANRYLVPSVMDRNLISILVDGINSHEITAYQTYDASINKLLEPVNDDPNALKTLIDSKIGVFTPKQYGELESGLSKLCLRVVEDWYFDTNRSEFKSFIFAIGLEYAGAEILGQLNNDDLSKDLKNPAIKLGEAGKGMTPLFWINYPTVRDYLCKFRVYNQNEKIRYSFDDVFQLRYFSSLIIEESNVSGTRIGDMKTVNGKDLSGLDKLLEADRVKKSLIQFEQDMWEQ
ncbi:MAG: gliding motility protein GldN [Bacteroidetes bacterium]|nr:gliding motility protein GldN [Bacteroidota bacterium]MBU1372380.1 gliding motility protein GldN [Bacteroidota bacterium]MBU1483404.1 gliding motility protein GldN [Bacteroidota bacterium]MBU1761713.1 gliding motility protein GldN [Bacteroidota bacterium]MBU2267351.1 gliding motility protein GldN [Bacteroidota bacterium]